MIVVLPLAIPWFLAPILTQFDGRRAWVAALALAGLAASSAASIWLATTVFRQGAVQMVTGGWPANIGIALRVDALGVLFLILSNVLLFVALAYEILGQTHDRSFPAVLLFLAAGLNGLFLAGDLFNFYVFFEVSMTASFVLTSHGKGRREIRNALNFTVVNLLGSIVFLAAVTSLYHLTGTLNLREIAIWVDTVAPTSIILTATLIFVAFSLKLGLFPFHFWLPAVYTGSRPVVASVLSGVLANIGAYGLIRFGADVLTRELAFAATVLLVLGVASVLYGGILALSRKTSPAVLAYSSISQAGYILIALAIGGSLGLAAAVLMAVVNALNKTLLFLASGARGSLVSLAYVLGAFSVAGVPPAVGFFAKAALFRAGLDSDRFILVALLFLGSALSFVYMFQDYQRAFWHATETSNPAPVARRMVVLALGILVTVLGLWPQPLLAAALQAASVLQGSVP